MEELFRLVVLALLQGLTEFLPISSSAHLILPAQLLGWPDQGLAFDIAVHAGSLLAVLIYFRVDLQQMGSGSLLALQRRQWNPQARMVLLLCIATIPVGVAGVLLEDLVATTLRSVGVIAIATIGFGLLLGWADRRRTAVNTELNIRTAIWIGCAQMLAIIPGTSRSGITITAALLCGLDRQAAARFSFLLSIPVILGAALVLGFEQSQSSLTIAWGSLALAFMVAAVTAYLTIGWFLTLIDRIGLMPFVVYRCVLGLGLDRKSVV